MSTESPPLGVYAAEDHQNASDPFTTNSQDAHRQRYSAFDNSQFSLYLNGSPAQAKRALQAHLAETTRRLQETSHLGNALVLQRQELEQRLEEVAKQEEDSDIGPELRRKLAELEKEFNEVGRETARAFLPKSRVPSGEADATAGASVFTSEAHHSPTKVSVPSRKQRNQQPSRINDIALATEISTSLLAQLKELQAVLLEKDELLKSTNLDRSQLEIEVEGLSQRLRTLDESESRLKDVNWNLETQVREFEVQSKVAADKEHRLNQTLNLARLEKATLEREFEELKQLHAKTNEDHTFKIKQHESELSGLRRNVSMGETERGALQRKLEELATQNHELARAVQHRIRSDEQASAEDTSPDEGAEEGNTITPEHSPPPSPTKATPRHGQLESETLKHSLHHAHRMIQQLKNNIHREKTEKIELKRMLQDARDELETSRSALNGPGSASKRRKNDKDVFKKPPRPDRLGALRTGSQEIVLDEDEWEDHDGVPNTPSRQPKRAELVPGAFPGGFSSTTETSANEDFETANETSDAAFETANERDGTTTETDAFQTGAETLDGDSSDDLTETEAGPSTAGTVRQRPPSLSTSHQDSYESTASTSGDEWDAAEMKTPVPSQNSRPRFKVRQSVYRRSTPRASQELYPDTPPAAKDSPTSLVGNSNRSTPAQGKSLFAELDALNAGESEDESILEGTPSRSSVLYLDSSPETFKKTVASHSSLQAAMPVKARMVDSSMMTEPWTPSPPTQGMEVSSVSAQCTEPQTSSLPYFTLSKLAAQSTRPHPVFTPALAKSTFAVLDTVPQSQSVPPFHLSTLAAQSTEPQSGYPVPLQISQLSRQDTSPQYVPLPSLQVSNLATEKTSPSYPPLPTLDMSRVYGHGTTPQSLALPSLALSSFKSHRTEPMSPPAVRPISPMLRVSPITQETTGPIDSHVPAVPVFISDLSQTISSQSTEPLESRTDDSFTNVKEASRETLIDISTSSGQNATRVQSPQLSLSMSGLLTQGTAPVESPQPAPPQLSTVATQVTEPVEMPNPVSPQLSVVAQQVTEPVASRPLPFEFSSFSQEITEPTASKHLLSRLSSVSHLVTEPVDSRPSLLDRSHLATLVTNPVELPRPSTPQLSIVSHLLTTPDEPPRPAPWEVAKIATQRTEPAESLVPLQPVHRMSDIMVLQDVHPESSTPIERRPSSAKRVPPNTLSMSNIVSEETGPSVPSGSLAAQRTRPIGVLTASHEASQEHPTGSRERVPLAPTSSNVQKDRDADDGYPSTYNVKTATPDESTQTMVSAEQIDRLLLARSQRNTGTIATAGIEKRMSPPASPSRRNSNEPVRSPRRPGSSSSMHSRGASPPPLPPDHREVIAAATLKSPLSLAVPASPGAMGPPIMPASAYKKRPQTPSLKTGNVATSPKPSGTTPRPRYPSQTRSGATSPITRRSSVSSFSSEIDHRFNNSGGPAFGQGSLDPNITDPRMIQAITQTMIGEFLWKYTRKAGRESMSETRHRRFFWVHPYTRTLYWSEQDPSTAGRAQLKAKSVAIEAVHEVSDDNPLPPGLHQKSLVVITPGRTIKFTATTSQRHETWFNALSYLLKRSQEDEDGHVLATNEGENEFNSGYRSSSRQTGRSRASMSTYNTRRTSSPHHGQIPTLRQSTVAPQRPASTEPGQTSVGGRLGTMLRSSSAMRGSFSSRFSRSSAQDASVSYEEPNSPAADPNRDLTQSNARDLDRMELLDVRACCDGACSAPHSFMR